MKKLVSIFAFIYASTLWAGDTYMIGHSLVNHEMPRIIQQLAEERELPFSTRNAIINGASLRYHWNNHQSAEGGVDTMVDLPTGNYDTLVLTEQVPIQVSFTWNDPIDYATRFINLALPLQPQLQVYLYQTWPHITNEPPREWQQATWDEEMTVDLSLFENAADTLTQDLNIPQVYIIPGGLALRQLRDEITEGTVPGLTSFEQLFRDDIHLNEEGNYFIALVFFATLLGEDPRGSTGLIYGPFNNVYVDVPQDRKQRYQEIAWTVVSGYERSGVQQTTTATPTASDDRYTYTKTSLTDLKLARYSSSRQQAHHGPDPELSPGNSKTNTIMEVPAPGVLSNDSAGPDGAGDLHVALVEGPTNGVVNLLSDGSFTYAPQPGFSGEDTFSYRIYDGTLAGNTATVTMEVP